jgi:TolC family type I secretion outer membrane protein
MRSFAQYGLSLLLMLAAAATSALDLKQAYQAALEQDASTNAARAAAAAGRENLPLARAQLFPSVSASFSRFDNRLNSVTPNSLGQLSDTAYTYPSSNNSVTLRQPVYRRYQWAQYQQAQAQVDDANAVLDTELQNLSVRVTGAYFEALLAQDQLLLIQTQLKAYRTQLDAAQKMFNAGSGTRTDVDEVQARLDLSLAQEMEARQNVESTRQMLQVLVNQPFDRLAEVDSGKLQLLPPQPENLEGWVERAEQVSPELRVLRARVETARFEVEKAGAGHHPTLDAVVQWTRSSSENIQAVESSYESTAIGLQLNVPIFSGGSVNAAIRQALANKERAEQTLEAARRDLGVRVYKEFRGVTEGVLRVRALEQAVKSADQALLSSQKSFQAGNRTRIDILNAENAKMVALRDLAQARYVYLISTLRLKTFVEEANLQAIEAINAAFTQAVN